MFSLGGYAPPMTPRISVWCVSGPPAPRAHPRGGGAPPDLSPGGCAPTLRSPIDSVVSLGWYETEGVGMGWDETEEELEWGGVVSFSIGQIH